MSAVKQFVARHRRMAGTAGLILLYALLCFSLPTGTLRKAFADISQLLLLLAVSGVMLWNAASNSGRTRVFWGLMSAGCMVWAVTLAMWTFYEVVLGRGIPEPFAGDVILFIHVVFFMAAVALQPHLEVEEQKLYFSTLNFSLLLAWWVFLYAFVVFPDEFVVLNTGVYSRNFDLLYLLENVALLLALAVLALRTRGSWKRVYWNLFMAFGLYVLSSGFINAAIDRGQYTSGGIYDVPFVASLCWLLAAGLLARELRPAGHPDPPPPRRWSVWAPRLARLAILSLPAMGYWAWFESQAGSRVRSFRLLVTLVAMLVVGVFIFVRQYLMDRDLVRLLEESRRSFDNLQRLQAQVVQKEKLASLGQLVAGAAHEINAPLENVLSCAGLLLSHEGLAAKQISMTQKIGEQARRTQELISGLLSFAQQSPGEKTQVDLGSVLHRAVQMKMIQLESQGIGLQTKISPGLPPIQGNASQLVRCCLEIIENAADAMEGGEGGSLLITANREGEQVVLEFTDSGPGVQDLQHVFDPFYTTKPVGKGTGLGLSATYGVVQDHHGQISCHNRPDRGAVFTMRFPVIQQSAALHADAAKA